MAITLANQLASAVYSVRLTHADDFGEQVRKVFKINDTGTTDEDLEAFLQAYEALTDAGIVNASASIDAGLTGANTSVGTGEFNKVNYLLVLGFQRVHPLNAGKIATTSFAIPAPADVIVDANGAPVMTRGTGFAAAAGVSEAMGALVDYLEDNLTMTPIDGTTYVGGWTYAAGRSGLVSRASVIDGQPLT